MLRTVNQRWTLAFAGSRSHHALAGMLPCPVWHMYILHFCISTYAVVAYAHMRYLHMHICSLCICTYAVMLQPFSDAVKSRQFFCSADMGWLLRKVQKLHAAIRQYYRQFKTKKRRRNASVMQGLIIIVKQIKARR